MKGKQNWTLALLATANQFGYFFTTDKWNISLKRLNKITCTSAWKMFLILPWKPLLCMQNSNENNFSKPQPAVFNLPVLVLPVKHKQYFKKNSKRKTTGIKSRELTHIYWHQWETQCKAFRRITLSEHFCCKWKKYFLTTETSSYPDCWPYNSTQRTNTIA